MSSRIGAFALVVILIAGCAGTPASPEANLNTASASATAAPTATAASPTPSRSPATTPRPIFAVIDDIDPARLQAHLLALTAFESRDPRHPGHAKAITYLKDQLGQISGVTVQSQRFVYQGIPLENIFGVIDPPGGAPPGGWLLVLAHFDSTANRTPGWRPAIDPAPGADDNATGTASLLEYARILAADRDSLQQRVVLGFMDGEELFFKGSAAYLATMPTPIPYANVLNVDMVGFNPIADRLDLIWYAQVSAGLRDRVIEANDRYQTGISPLIQQFASDPNRTILDTAPWGLAGVPAVALVERYGEADATYPGNSTFHTVNDTPDRVTNPRLWLKASRLMLAVALELAR